MRINNWIIPQNPTFVNTLSHCCGIMLNLDSARHQPIKAQASGSSNHNTYQGESKLLCRLCFFESFPTVTVLERMAYLFVLTNLGLINNIIISHIMFYTLAFRQKA